jgi:protoporphyrinogen oxidase
LYAGIDLHLGMTAVRVDAARRRVAFADGLETGYDAMVSTIPLPELVRMIPGVPADIREAAGQLRALRQFCVNLVVEREALSPANWFYVYDPDIAVSRVSFPYSLSGETNGRTAIQAEIFLPGDARADEAALRDQAVADLGRLLQFSPSDVAATEIRSYPYSYVVSDLNRAAAVRQVRDWLRGHDIETAGLFGSWHYVWSDRAFAAGSDLAELIHQSH